MNSTEKHTQHESAYNGMLNHARSFLHDTTNDLGNNVHNAIESAKEKAVHLKELTKEEAEQIGQYLRRDIQDAGEYIHQQRGELADWLRLEFIAGGGQNHHRTGTHP